MKTIIAILVFIVSYTMHATGVLIHTKNNQVELPKEVSVSTVINDQVAQTVTTQKFYTNQRTTMTAQYAFSLPPNAVVTAFQWKIRGKSYKGLITGNPMDTIQQGGSQGGDNQVYPTALRQYLGNSAFVFSFKDSLTLADTLSIELTYIELLEYSSGKVSVQYPLSLQVFNPTDIQCSYSCTISSARPILDIKSVHHTCDIARETHSALIAIKQTKIIPQSNIILECFFDQKELGVICYSNKPSHNEKGYMTLLIEPARQQDNQNVIEKVFTFVIDISGSMTGEKLSNAKKAVHYCIDRLNSHDFFNIVAFNSSTVKFHTQLVNATPDNIEKARSFIDKLQAQGGTDIQNALLDGLLQGMTNKTANTIVLLTDGQSIVNQDIITSANRKNTRIYVFGVGADVDKKVLNDIAMNNNGVADFVINSADTEGTIGNLYSKIRNPLYKNVRLFWSREDVKEVYPLIMQDIYMGEQMIIVGLYTKPGPIQLILKAEGRSEPVEFTYSFVLSADSLNDVFTPKIWATYKIKELLRLMNSESTGSTRWNEWRKEIISLGIQYGIVTKFTSFSDFTPDDDENDDENDDGGNSTTWVEETDIPISDNLVIAPHPYTGKGRFDIVLQEGDTPQDCSEIVLFGSNGNKVSILPEWYSLEGNILHITLPEGILSSGVYFIRLVCGSTINKGKMIVLPAP